VLVTPHIKLDEEKSKYASLAQQNGFGLAFLFFLFAEARTSVLAREECNKYDLTPGPCFSLDNRNDWSRWVTISSLPPMGHISF
jgi:hypothetical protein